ncbi:hypothetical protein [Sulfurimonas sp. C5]|uniref:hypothetical protein n=1 Tax=Sulfurimonas sp. C5 TaxID=3036947 RepID=UPI002454FC32|nr:hypothetical protein [Sulfurimonas sp. C5]MDH4943826.1 hypothetical protein [Sulfurimonas sp. C5]
MTENEKLTLLLAVISIIVSLFTIYISTKNAENSNRLAEEALKISRQSNEISLGLVKELPAIEIITENKKFDFTNTNTLQEDLKNVLTIKNIGKVPIDALHMEVIGITPFTYPLDEPNAVMRPLPSISISIPFDAMLLPNALAHVDLRLPIMKYLSKLTIHDQTIPYTSMINIVLAPKSINENTPSGISSNVTTKDRILVTVLFKPSILSEEFSKKILKNEKIIHRIFSPD